MNTHRRRLALLLPAAVTALSLAGMAGAQTAATAADPAAGTVGVCVRWGADDSRLEDVVVVEPSGNKPLDAAIPGALLGMQWTKPSGNGGEWVALSVGVAGSQPSAKLPNCAALGPEEATGPARPLATGKSLAV